MDAVGELEGTVSLHGGVHTRRWISMGDFMARLAVPSFYSATVLEQRHPATAITEVAPWRGILAVEPDLAVLNAKSVLLTQANYSVTLATNDSDLFSLQTTKAFALAILSDRLGRGLLGAVAQIIRKQWPRARILIMGEVPRMLEDYLYDEQICRSSDPKQVLANLEGLYEGMWNERSNSIDWHPFKVSPRLHSTSKCSGIARL